MIISLTILGFIFLFVFVVYMFKLDALITNIDFEQIDECCHDTVRRQWFIWAGMLVIVLAIWTTIFTFYYRNDLLFIGGIICFIILTWVRLHYLTKKFKKG